MITNWLQRISPCPRPVHSGMIEDCAYTGRGTQSPGWIEPLRVIYDHQLVLISQGTYRTRIEDKDYLCPPHTYIIIPPGQWEATWNIGARSGRRLWCHFDWTYLGPWENTPLLTYHPAKPRRSNFRPAPDFIPSPVFHGIIPNPQLAFDLFDRFFQKQHFGDSHDQLTARSLLLELLIQLLNERSERSPQIRRSPHLASMVRTQLKNAAESGDSIPSIRNLLEKSRYSYAHLCRLFRKEYGIPPLRYVQMLRIDRAKRLLTETTLDVSEIAYRVGFNDPVYFSELFRKITGTAPSRYRKTLNQPRNKGRGMV